MTVISQLPRIRSIIRFTLPKFFHPETYIWNRFSSADAILVDIRKRDDDADASGWQRERLRQVLEKGPYKPRIYLEPTCRRKHPEIWQEDISTCTNPCLHGFLLDLEDGDVFPEAEEILKRGQLVQDQYKDLVKKMWHSFKDVSMLVDIETKSIPYIIYKYNFFGARGGWSHVNELADTAAAANLQMLGWRSRPLKLPKDIVKEMSILKDLGFVGFVLQDSAQIDLANKVFS